MESIINKYPRVKSFSFMDDNFSLDRQRVVELCNLIISKGLNKYPWDCLSRCDNMDESLLRTMKESGCIRIQYGIESGSEQILKNIGKHTDLNKAKEVIDLTKKFKIEAYAFFMVGNPGETEDSINKSIKYALDLKPTYLNWFVTQVYPEIQHCDDWARYIYEPEIKKPSLYTHPCVPTFNPLGFNREIFKNKVARIMRLFFWRYLLINYRKWFMKLIRHPLYSLWYVKRIFMEK